MHAMDPRHGRGQFMATVRANVPLCREHFKLVLHVPRFAPTEPGQFIQIECRPPGFEQLQEREVEWSPGQRADLHNRELLAPLALLRRPFSLAGRRDVDDGVELEVIHRVVGVGTDWLAHLSEVGAVSIIGPLGNSFTVPPGDGMAILVGGGVGIPPMLYLAQKLRGRRAVAFCGALTRELLPLTVVAEGPRTGGDRVEPRRSIAEFMYHDIPAVISTDDGSYGFRGFVTQALEKWLDSATLPAHSVIYTCGPEPMMKRVAQIAGSRRIECQIAVERAMACGMGTCQSCCIRVRKPDPSQPPLAGSEWCWRLACTDGPVFRGSDLLW